METCQRCGTVHEVGARYCPGCGHASASAGEPTQAYAAVGGQQGGAADGGMTWALPVQPDPGLSGGYPPQSGFADPGGFPIQAAEDPYADLFRPAGGGAPNPNATQVMPAAAPVHQADAQPAYDQPIDYQPGVGRPYSEPYEGPYADDYPPADGEPPRSSRAAKIGIGVAAVAVVVIVVSLITIGGGTPTPAATPGSQQTEVVTPTTGSQPTQSASHGPTGAPSTPHTSAPSHAPGVMQLGDQGNDVKWLQNRLKQLGYYDGDVNGVFDQNTQNAVAQFQAHTHPSDPSGVVGRSTKTALIAAGSKPRLSVFNAGGDGGKKGGNPEDIKRLQKALGVALNQNVRVSGTFDVETLGAVMQYQAAVGLGPDGVVGDKVWSALQQGKIVGQ